MNEQLMEAVMQGIQLIVIALVGYVAQAAARYFKKKGFMEENSAIRSIALDAVKFVEQVYKHLDGEEKFKIARAEAVKALEKAGLKVTDDYLNVLIEGLVLEVNKAFDVEKGKVEIKVEQEPKGIE